MILKVRKDSMVFKQRDFIAKWFTEVDFHTLEAIMFLLTTTEEKEDALTLFYELGISSQDQFCLEIEVNRLFALSGHVTSFLWKWKLYDFAFEKRLVGHILNEIIVIWFFKPAPFS